MSVLNAVAIILAYQHQNKLTGAMRRRLAEAYAVVWKHAEQTRIRDED